MKKVLALLCIVVAAAACSKDDKKTPAPANTNNHMHFIPNWANDTLTGRVFDDQDLNVIAHDTMYSGHNGDSSFIVYKGVKYYVWVVSDTVFGDDFVEDWAWYGNCWIGTVAFDTAHGTIQDAAATAVPAQFHNPSTGNTETQTQTLTVAQGAKSSFPEHLYGGIYSSSH